MGVRADLGAPASLAVILRCLDPADEGTRIIIADDLIVQQALTRRHFVEATNFLGGLLADPGIASVDLKGMLNRLVGRAWSVPYEFGADANGARSFLEALHAALKQRQT